MGENRKYFDETEYMSFLIKNDELLEKYNKTWDKVSNTVEKRFDIEPVCDEKYLKTKIKPSEEKINKTFHKDRMLRKRFSLFLSISNID